jgi:hypothetical protein
MSVESAPVATPPSPRLPVAILLAAVGLLTVLGAVLALTTIVGGRNEPPPLPDGPFALAEDIPTSFGAVAVEHAEKIAGLGAKQLAGATHGIQNLVPPDKIQVQASATLTNLTLGPVRYAPEQFSLLVGKGSKPDPGQRPIPVQTASIRPGTLQPDAAIDARLSFVAPRSGERLWIAFDDPGRSEPVLIDLGRTQRTPSNAFEGFHRAHR